MDCTYLANSDGFALVSKRETTELWVIGEALHTDGLGGLDERDNFLPPLCKLRRTLRLAPGRLVEVVEECLCGLYVSFWYLIEREVHVRTARVTSSEIV